MISFYSCFCDPNYTGPKCDVHVDYCAGVTCHNGGTCVDTGYAFHCQCQGGFYG